MSVAYSNISTAFPTGGATSSTFSHTVSGSNRLLIVSIYSDNSIGTVACTFATVPMTLLRNTGGVVYTFYLIAPTVGTANVALTWVGGSAAYVVAISYTGVHQVTPIGTPSYSQNSSTLVTGTASSTSGELVVDLAAVNGNNTTWTATSDINQTDRNNPAPGRQRRLLLSEKGGANPVTMQWSLSGTTTGRTWATHLVPLKPAVTSFTSILTGGDTPIGALIKMVSRIFTAGITPSGVLSILRFIPREFTSSITPAGDVTPVRVERFVITLPSEQAVVRFDVKDGTIVLDDENVKVRS